MLGEIEDDADVILSIGENVVCVVVVDAGDVVGVNVAIVADVDVDGFEVLVLGGVVPFIGVLTELL